MPTRPPRPSIMDSPSAQRAVLGAGAVLAAAGSLRGVEREVGVADEAVGGAAARVANGDSERRADHHAVAFDAVRAGDLLDQGPRERFQQADVDRARKYRLELVAAQAPDLAMLAHDRF